MTVDKLPKPAPSFRQIVVRTLVVIGGLALFGALIGKKEQAATPTAASDLSSDGYVSVDQQTWQTRDPAILDVSIVNDDQNAVRNIVVSCAFFNAADAEIASSTRTISDFVDARSRRLIAGVNFGSVKTDAATVSCHVTKADRVSAAEQAMASVEIRGVRLRMLPTELPAEFKRLSIVPSPSATAADQSEQCAPNTQGKETCFTIFFDGTSKEKRVYAVLLDLVPLGTNDLRVAEEILAKKYGPPKDRVESTSLITNLSWGFFRFGRVGTPRSIIENPDFVNMTSRGLSVEKDLLVAQIFGGSSGYYATLALVDVPSAFRIRKVFDGRMKEQRDTAAKEGVKRAKPDRF